MNVIWVQNGRLGRFAFHSVEASLQVWDPPTAYHPFASSSLTPSSVSPPTPPRECSFSELAPWPSLSSFSSGLSKSVLSHLSLVPIPPHHQLFLPSFSPAEGIFICVTPALEQVTLGVLSCGIVNKSHRDVVEVILGWERRATAGLNSSGWAHRLEAVFGNLEVGVLPDACKGGSFLSQIKPSWHIFANT